MTRDELVNLIRKIMEAEGTEAEIDGYMATVTSNVPHPNWTDLVFHDERDLTPEQMVDEALAYRPITLDRPL